MSIDTVLVSAAGSTNGVNVIKALRSQNECDLRVVGIDSDAYAAGLHLAELQEVVPKVSEPTFLERVLQICKTYDVSMLIPTHSVELRFYSSTQETFEQRGVKLMVSPIDMLETCDDKMKLARFLHKLGTKYPKHYELSDATHISEASFPLFIKPRFGSGSSYAHKIDSPEDLTFYLKRTPDPIVQECIEGEEYTVNLVSDFQGKVIGALPIKRLRVRGGLSVLAETELDPGLIEEAREIVEALHLVGPSNVQIIVRSGERIVIEVNPRFASGSLPLAIAAGLDIPLIMVRLMKGIPIPELRLQGGKKMARYWDSVILDQTEVKI